MTLDQVKVFCLNSVHKIGFHSEHNLNLLDVVLTGTNLFISSKNKKQQGQFKLIIFILREGVSVSCNIKLECDFHRCWSLSGRSPEILKSRMIQYI